jgi:hypothetical protein
MPNPHIIRNAEPADFAQVLALNEESVRFLSPMDAPRLALLHSQAAYHRVVESSGQVGAFMMAHRNGSAYDSVNFHWFAERYPNFLYIDRIALANFSTKTSSPSPAAQAPNSSPANSTLIPPTPPQKNSTKPLVSKKLALRLTVLRTNALLCRLWRFEAFMAVRALRSTRSPASYHRAVASESF